VADTSRASQLRSPVGHTESNLASWISTGPQGEARPRCRSSLTSSRSSCSSSPLTARS